MSFYSNVRRELQEAQREAGEILKDNKIKDAKNVGAAAFTRSIPGAIKYVSQEPEVLFFSALQWLVVGLAYLLWVQFLDWIPQGVWDEIKRAEELDKGTDGMFIMLSLVLTGWSFLVVCAASYPLAILNAAIVASVNLRQAGRTSTVWNCLQQGLNNLSRSWAFTVVDAWITVRRIFNRLPRKNDRESAVSKAAKEALYYAWKLGTIGVVPALVNGRGFVEAGKDSILLLRTRLWDVVKLRFGYSAVCWIIGVLAYLGGVVYYAAMSGDNGNKPNIYSFYMMMGMPIFVATGVVCLIRPLYLVLLAKLYSEVVPVEPIEGQGRVASSITFVLFLLLLAALAAAVTFGDHLGLRAFIEQIAAKSPTH